MRPLLLERFYARWEFEVGLNLSASDPEPVPLARLLAMADPEARRLWENLTLGYAEPDGLPALRAEIAGQYDDLPAGGVVLTTGAQEAIYLTMRSLVEPGDHVVVIAPAYQVLYDGARLAGARVTLVPLEAARGWKLDVDAVVSAFEPDTKLLVINFPHNPTGAQPTRIEQWRLVAACAERGIRLISDEVFRGTEPTPELRLPAAVEVDRRAVSIGDVSKSYGLAGLRVGWIACHDPKLLNRVAHYRDYTTISGAGPSQVLALTALRNREALQERARRLVGHNLALVRPFFARHQDLIEWTPPVAGTTTFPRLRRGDVEVFSERLATDQGVLLAPGSVFEMPGGYFRLGLGQKGVERGLPALGRAFAHL